MRDMTIKDCHWYDEEHDLNVFFAVFPNGADEFITLNEDGSYTAFIACNRCPERMRKAYLHAVDHIINDDFYSPDSVDQIETRCHRNQATNKNCRS